MNSNSNPNNPDQPFERYAPIYAEIIQREIAVIEGKRRGDHSYSDGWIELTYTAVDNDLRVKLKTPSGDATYVTDANGRI